MLTPDQQVLVEEAIQLVPTCVRVFLKAMPRLRGVVRQSELESAAYLACVKAARTFDPSRGVGVSCYFSVAIKNGMLREVLQEIRRRGRSRCMLTVEEVELVVLQRRKAPTDALASLSAMEDHERRMIEQHLFEGVSFRELGRIYGISGKSAKKKFMSYLDKAKEIHDDSAFS